MGGKDVPRRVYSIRSMLKVKSFVVYYLTQGHNHSHTALGKQTNTPHFTVLLSQMLRQCHISFSHNYSFLCLCCFSQRHTQQLAHLTTHKQAITPSLLYGKSILTEAHKYADPGKFFHTKTGYHLSPVLR